MWPFGWPELCYYVLIKICFLYEEVEIAREKDQKCYLNTIQETLASKLESLNKGNTQLKYKYEELKAMSASKDELITRLENEMKELSVFVEKTIKVLN